MVTTTWIVGSGDWNTVSNWSNGVPTTTDTAIFTSPPYQGTYTVTGPGVAEALDIAYGSLPVLAGALTTSTLLLNHASAELAATAALTFATGTISVASLQIDPGANLGTGALTLSNATLTTPSVGTLGALGDAGTLANPITLATNSTLEANVTLAGPVTGAGALYVEAGTVRLDNAADSLTGGLQIGALNGNPLFGVGLAAVTLAGSGASIGQVLLGSGTLTLNPGVTTGAITAATGFGDAVLSLSNQSPQCLPANTISL